MRTLAQADATKKIRKRHSEKINPQISALTTDAIDMPQRRGSAGSNPNSPRGRKTMSPDAFKKKYTVTGNPDAVRGGNKSRFGGNDQESEGSEEIETKAKVIPQIVEVRGSNSDEEQEWGV
jgi:hypothetical protein